MRNDTMKIVSFFFYKKRKRLQFYNDKKSFE